MLKYVKHGAIQYEGRKKNLELSSLRVNERSALMSITAGHNVVSGPGGMVTILYPAFTTFPFQDQIADQAHLLLAVHQSIYQTWNWWLVPQCL